MYEYKCKMVKVVDGDTVDVDIDLGFGVWMRDQRIRLYGIDTPESRTSDDKEKVYGLAAKDFVVKWTNAGDLSLKTFKDDRGKFGRILGEIWYGGKHNVSNYSFYSQIDGKINERLNLSLGSRYEYFNFSTNFPNTELRHFLKETIILVKRLLMSLQLLQCLILYFQKNQEFHYTNHL